MAYQVIARKWRPQTLQDLIGQDHVGMTLINALRSGRLHPVLLFTGPRGTGKTSTARILAKSLRCPNAKDFVPCNACISCDEIAAGRSPDVQELDGASNNSVDDIRRLLDTVPYMPTSGRHKVYIIDEVHMLSTSAFNALLKTTEEPPDHVVFIMATTEVQKVPRTILSRVQQFDFRRISSRLITSHLEKICRADNVKFEPEALWRIAHHADGSMRDSQSLLDQVMTFASGDLSLAKVIEVMGLTDRTLLLETIESLAKRDLAKATSVIEKLGRTGTDPKVFAQELLEEIRNAMMIRMGGNHPEKFVDLPDSEIAELKRLTAEVSDEDIHLLFDMTLKGVNDILRSQDSRLVLEMLLLRLANAPRVANLQAIIQYLDANGSGSATLNSPTVTPKASSAGNSNPNNKNSNSSSPSSGSATRTLSTPVATTSSAHGFSSANASTSTLSSTAKNISSPTKQHTIASDSALPAGETSSANAPAKLSATEEAHSKVLDPWFQFVEKIKKSNGLLGAMLENTHILEQTDRDLVIGVSKKVGFMFDKLKESDNIGRIENFVETIWHKTLKVEVKLVDEAKEVKESLSPKAFSEKIKSDEKKSVEDLVDAHPLVRSAKSTFKAQVKSIKERP